VVPLAFGEQGFQELDFHFFLVLSALTPPLTTRSIRLPMTHPQFTIQPPPKEFSPNSIHGSMSEPVISLPPQRS